MHHRVYKRQFEILQAAMDAGTQKPCFMTEFLENSEKLGYDDNQRYFVAGTLLEAGSDTTRATLGQLIAAIATDPRWVATAREELDRVCGANAERLPGWDDEDSLPYIKAVVKETLRWRFVFFRATAWAMANVHVRQTQPHRHGRTNCPDSR